MNFTWRRFWHELKTVIVFVAAVLIFLGITPKLIAGALIAWQIVTRGGAIASFLKTIGVWIKNGYNKLLNKNK